MVDIPNLGECFLLAGDDDHPMSPTQEWDTLCLDFGIDVAHTIAKNELAKAEAAGDAEKVQYWALVTACVLKPEARLKLA